MYVPGFGCVQKFQIVYKNFRMCTKISDCVQKFQACIRKIRATSAFQNSLGVIWRLSEPSEIIRESRKCKIFALRARYFYQNFLTKIRCVFKEKLRPKGAKFMYDPENEKKKHWTQLSIFVRKKEEHLKLEFVILYR